MADDNLNKLRSAFGKLKSHQAAGAVLLEEIESLLASNATVKDHVKRLFACWAEHWHQQYREPYVFAGARDTAQFKRLLKAIDVDELEARMKHYLGNPDPFFSKNRHPLGIFVSTINAHGKAAPKRSIVSTRAVCDHEPRCPSTWAHGTLRAAEAAGDTELVAGLLAMHERQAKGEARA
jgi:hypothetical protein